MSQYVPMASTLVREPFVLDPLPCPQGGLAPLERVRDPGIGGFAAFPGLRRLAGLGAVGELVARLRGSDRLLEPASSSRGRCGSWRPELEGGL